MATEASPFEKVTNANLILLTYDDSLQGNIKRRYIEKVSEIGLDRFLIPLLFCKRIALFDPKYLDLSYPELDKECYKFGLNLSEEDVQSIGKETLDVHFFRPRAGRIGASKCHAASHTDPTQPS